MQEHKQKCARLVPNVEHKHILQPLKYLIFIVNRFHYMNINVTKNRIIILMNLLGPYRFNLQTTVGHHWHSMNCGHYTASIIVVEIILCQLYQNYLMYINDTRFSKSNWRLKGGNQQTVTIIYQFCRWPEYISIQKFQAIPQFLRKAVPCCNVLSHDSRYAHWVIFRWPIRAARLSRK